MKINKKVIVAPLTKVLLDHANNVRGESDYAKIRTLKADLEFQGQTDPALVEEVGDHYIPIRGNLRATALNELAAEGKINPKTGKVFDSIDVQIVEDLTERERVALMIDHSQRLGLDREGCFLAACRLYGAGYTEFDVAIMLAGSLEQNWPASRKVKPVEEDNGKDLGEYRRGLCQVLKAGYFAPTILKNAYQAKLQGQQAWPRDSDMKALVKIHVEEMGEDKTATINRNNPGPKFRARWEKLLAELEKAKATGKPPKAISMAGRPKVEDYKKASDSRTLKTVFGIILRDIGEETLPALDKLLVEAESKMPVEWHNMLTAILTSGEPEQEPTGEEPTGEEPTGE